MMVGADIGEVKAASGREASIPRLVIHHLSLEPDDPHGTQLDDVCLEVRGGEIVGIAGVAGNGQDELFAALSGERLSNSEGDVVIDGNAAGTFGVTERRRMGVAFVPEERLGHGAAPRMKLSENALLTGHAASGMVKKGFIDKQATLAHVDRRPSRLTCARPSAIRKLSASPAATCRSSSSDARFCVSHAFLSSASRPGASTPGRRPSIRQALIDLAARGAAVLVISQDLDELEEIADRIAVMFHGRLSAPLAAAEVTREKLGLLMGGANPERNVGGPEVKHAVGA